MSAANTKLDWARRLLGNADPRAEQAGIPWAGERVDVERFWAEAWRDLQYRQGQLAKRGKLAHASWTVDQSAGLIQFERANGELATAPVQIIGSWNPAIEIFTWGWDHPSVRTRLRAFAERTRWFGEAHALPELTESRQRATELEAWRLTAIALKVNGAMGAYRGPTEGPVIFMNIGELTERQ
jgi:hypothetical protein